MNIKKQLIQVRKDYKETLKDMKKRGECKCQYPYINGYFTGYIDALKKQEGLK